MKPERHLKIAGSGPQPGSEASPSPLSGFGSRGPSSPQNFDELVREWEERMDEAEKALDAVLERVRDA
jgi:hypothetical protein